VSPGRAADGAAMPVVCLACRMAAEVAELTYEGPAALVGLVAQMLREEGLLSVTSHQRRAETYRRRRRRRLSCWL
jgi:hypothetical protein